MSVTPSASLPERNSSAPPTPATDEHPLAFAARIGSRFDVVGPLEAFDFPDKGNINRDTFVLRCGPSDDTSEFLLQRINQEVFTQPDAVMAAMLASLHAQRRSLNSECAPEGCEWEVSSLGATREGAPYLMNEDRRGTTYWRLMHKISACKTYKSLSEITSRSEQLCVAEEAGRGLALYGDFTADMNIVGLVSPLPGYRVTHLYYDQLDSVLNGNRTLDDVSSLLPTDPTLRHSTEEHFMLHLTEGEFAKRSRDPDLQHFVELVRAEKAFALTLEREMKSGAIRTVAIHGDTKLENFLFSTRTGCVKSLVDLDTIIAHTWLADWGDMVRSLANGAGEKEIDLTRVDVDMEIYAAVARGFLRTAREVTEAEVALMTEAVEVIALELGLRCMTDYLRGDNYFKLSPADPPELNKVRGMAQLTLFERLRKRSHETKNCIRDLISHL